MAMRPRRGGARSGVVRPVYEAFRPGSEWQHDDDSHILTISLPGFMKEQIRVSTEGHNTIRVRGERLVAGNKWNRFQEDFQVPDNGEMNSVRAKFQGGTLTITVPKVKVTLSPKTERIDDVQKQPTPHKGQEKEADTSQATDEKATETTKTLMDAGMKQGQDGDRKQPTSEKSRDEDLPAIDTRKTTDEKSSEPDAEEENRKILEKDRARDVLVNMGAAMLVIVALTAYVTYSFVSAKDKN